jgi:hypothetical protein
MQHAPNAGFNALYGELLDLIASVTMGFSTQPLRNSYYDAQIHSHEVHKLQPQHYSPLS